MSRLRKISGATWIALANMVLTLLIGVFFALYLKGRDEEFALRLKDREELLQKQLIELQAETERRANIANIQFVSECSDPLSCRGHVALKNLSQTTAKNVKVVLFVRHFDNRWSNGLNSIDLFSIKTSPASLQISSEVKTINTYYAQVLQGNNAVEMNIVTLPPQSVVDIYVAEQPNLPLQRREITRTVEMIVPKAYSNKDNVQSLAGDKLLEAMRRRLSIALFQVEVGCENCEGNTTTYTEVSMLQSVYADSLWLSGNNGTDDLWTVKTRISYYAPEGSVFEPSDQLFEITDDNNISPITIVRPRSVISP